jgi:hypothetical protein
MHKTFSSTTKSSLILFECPCDRSVSNAKNALVRVLPPVNIRADCVRQALVQLHLPYPSTFPTSWSNLTLSLSQCGVASWIACRDDSPGAVVTRPHRQRRLEASATLQWTQLTNRALIRLSGVDVSPFLQGLITNDMKYDGVPMLNNKVVMLLNLDTFTNLVSGARRPG